MTTTTRAPRNPERTAKRAAWRSRHGWTAGVWVLLFVLVAWYAALIPRFGSFQVTSLVKNSLPLVFLALAQAVIVISGGIDLGVGGMMVLANSAAAAYMEGQPFWATVVIGMGVIAALAIMNGVVGLVISVSKVPDIVITLATGFIYGGLALIVLPGPGGGTSEAFRWMFTGSNTGVGSNFWPPLILMAVVTVVVAYFMKKTKTGLSLYANGSDRYAAYLSGVDTRRAKVIAYGVGGALSGLSGLAIIALTNIGDPRFAIGGQATLQSVAAIVIGGIALVGGVGSVVGVVAAGIIVFFLDVLLVAIGFDPNTSQVVQGVLIVVVMMVAGLLEVRRRRLE